MCGRFTLRAPPRVVAGLFDLPEIGEFEARYNVAPTQEIVGVRLNRERTGREPALFRWGLIPSWAKDPSVGNGMINARSETAATKPAFRGALRERRLLIPADGFYEWKTVGRKRQPYLIEQEDGRPFAFAGLWERWHSPAGPIDSCTILTTQANELLRPLHDRMPVMLLQNDFEAWLDPAKDPEDVDYLLASFPAEEMKLTPVGTAVNSARHEGADCVEPLVDDEPVQKSFFD